MGNYDTGEEIGSGGVVMGMRMRHPGETLYDGWDGYGLRGVVEGSLAALEGPGDFLSGMPPLS